MAPAEPEAPFTSIARSTVWNFVGLLSPIPVALIAIPLLLAGLGTERFGILTLTWALIGHFSLFDFGLGRALTKAVAERLGRGDRDDIAAIAWTGLYLVIALGVVAALLFAALSPVLVRDVLRVPPALHDEARGAFVLLGLTVPFVTGYAGVRGLLEAWQRFDVTNAVRIPMGALTFLAPLAVLPFSRTVPAMVAALGVVRLLAFIVQLILLLRLVPSLAASFRPSAAQARALFRFGSWMTISNVVSPLMVTLDRFVIGAMVSLSAVAYYATPYEAVTKLLILPAALVGVLFPAFARLLATDEARTTRIFQRGVKALLVSMFPFTLVTIMFAREMLSIWLGRDFAVQSTAVLQLLTLGVFVNGLANVPFALIQGRGRPDLTAKVHLAELPLYVVGLALLVGSWGIVGAAVAWTARVAVDAALLFTIVDRRFLPDARWLRVWLPGLTATLLLCAVTANSLSVGWRVAVTFTVGLGFYRLVTTRLLEGDDRPFMIQGLRSLLRRQGA